MGSPLEASLVVRAAVTITTNGSIGCNYVIEEISDLEKQIWRSTRIVP